MSGTDSTGRSETKCALIRARGDYGSSRHYGLQVEPAREDAQPYAFRLDVQQAGLIDAVTAGMPLSVLGELAEKTSLSNTEIERLIVNRRTLSHRRERRKPLTVEESERVVRVLRLLDLVYDTLGEGEAVERWLRDPKPFLGERTPLEALETEAGARILEEELYALQYGFSA